MQGSSGCVLAPALTCNTEQPGNRFERRISKIYRQDIFYQEERDMINRMMLNTIDPDEDFCLYQFYACKIDRTNIENIDRINATTCRRNPGEPPIAWALNFKSGLFPDLNGILSNPLLPEVYYLKVLARLANVVNGIVALNYTNRYHLDVKESNIVQHNYVYKLIDFGLSEFDPVDDGPLPSTRRVFRSVYRYWPIEAILLSPDGINYVEQHVRNYLDGQVVGRGQNEIDPLLSAFSADILGVTPLNKNNKIKYWIEYIRNLRHKPHYKKKIFNTIDAWSINFILYRIWFTMPNGNLKTQLRNFLTNILIHDGEKRWSALHCKSKYSEFLTTILPADAYTFQAQINTAYQNWVRRTNTATAAAAAAAHAARALAIAAAADAHAVAAAAIAAANAAANDAAIAAANAAANAAAALAVANAAAAAAALDAARCGNYFMNMNRRCIADNGRAAGRIIAAGGHLGAPCAMNFNGRRCVKSAVEKVAGRQTAKAAKEAQRVLCNNYYLDAQGRRCIADNGKPGRLLRANNALGAPCAMVYHPATRRCRRAANL